MSILQNSQKKMFSNEISETAIFCEISRLIPWYFSQISVIKIELSTGEIDINLDKIFCNFLNWVHILPNLQQIQYVTGHIVKISGKSHK